MHYQRVIDDIREMADDLLSYLKEYKIGAIAGGVGSHLSIPVLQSLFYGSDLKNTIEYFYTQLPSDIIQKDPKLMFLYFLPVLIGVLMGAYLEYKFREEAKKINESEKQV